MVKSPSTNRDSYWLVSANLLVALLGVVSQYFILTNLDSIEYGYWILLLDATLSVGILVDFGIPDAMIRLWNGAREDVTRVVRRGLLAQSLLGLAILVISIPVVSIIDVEGISPISILLMVMGSILLYQLGSMRIGLRMLGRADEESVAVVFDRVLFIASILLALKVGPNINNLAIAFVCASFLSFSYTLWRYQKNRPKYALTEDNQHVENFSEVTTLIIAALPFAISLFIFPLFGRIDKFIIAWSEGVIQVAYFNIPWLVILSGLSVPKSIRQASLPDLASKRHDSSLKSKVVGDAWPISSLLIWIGVPSSMLISELVFSNVFPARLVSPGGEEFVGIRLLICLLPAWVWSMVGALELESLKLEQSSIKYSSIIGISLLINLFSGLFFIPILGILGAAISSMLGFISLFIIAFFSGPLISHHQTLFHKKCIIGAIYTIILFSIAIYWDSSMIKQSTYRAIVLVMIITSPITSLDFSEIRRRLSRTAYDIPEDEVV